jgi:ABC-2 type transport system permease protein
VTLWKIFRFEIGYQARRRSSWLYFAVAVGLALQIATQAFLPDARRGGYFFNGPFVIAAVTVIGSMFALLFAAAVAGDAATRDMQTRMEPLVYTTPVPKAAYLGGRFLGAFAIVGLLLAAVPLGLLIAVQLPGLEPELVGPFRLAAYLRPYMIFTVPSTFIVTALLFTMAALSRRALASYIGAAFLFVTPMLSNEWLAKHLGQWRLAKQLDPFGFTAISEISRSWTPLQKASQLIALDGAVLMNRILWFGIALATLALAHLGFRFAHHATRSTRVRFAGAITDGAVMNGATMARSVPMATPSIHRTFGLGTHMRQTLIIALRSLREIVTSWGALALAVVAAFLVIAGPELMEHIGIPLFPVTERIVAHLTSTGDVTGFIGVFLVIFYAGELIWRERETRLHVIADATPVPDWVPFLGKFLGLTFVVVLLQTMMMGGGMLTQARLGYFHFEPGVYLKLLFGVQLVNYLLLVALALAVHVVVNQKYVSHLVVILTYFSSAYASALGIEHNLLIYGADAGWDYTDMSGFGPHLAPLVWFKLYWVGWALLFVAIAKLLWARGTESGWRERLRLARSRMTGPSVAGLATTMAIVLIAGGFIFYNTNVLNPYRTTAQQEERRAEYERRHGRYEGVAQPQMTATSLRIELDPPRGTADIRGTYRLENKTSSPIDTIHVGTAAELETRSIAFDRAFAPRLIDEDFRHRIYTLKEPLQPGQSLGMSFHVRFARRGFRNSGVNASVMSNGTHFERDWLPAIGYQAGRELSNAGDRRKHGLPARPEIPPLHDVKARSDMTDSERISFDAVIGTAANETAIAPGKLQRTWNENGRRYFHYATEAPIRNGYAIFSSQYAVHTARWRDVEIQVAYHPRHPWNVERIVRATQAALEHFTREYGPYPHRQIRFVEAPGSSIGARSHPINIRYFEGFSLLNPDADARQADFAFAVAAHEVAHQWWGNQLTPAYAEGAPVMSESLAWFSAIGAVEDAHGPAHLRCLLDVLREGYLSPRARADVPLLRASDWFVSYRKGAFAMYALREYVGEEQVNLALRRLMQKHGAGAAPLPTTLDLYAELKAVTPPSQHGLLADLFEVNTFWDLSTKDAVAEPAPGGKWRVTMNVSAKKVAVDEVGTETPRPMNDLIEIGVFEDDELEKPLYLQKHRIRDGQQRITVTVARKPARAGIDPRNILIDTAWRDNAVAVDQKR